MPTYKADRPPQGMSKSIESQIADMRTYLNSLTSQLEYTLNNLDENNIPSVATFAAIMQINQSLISINKSIKNLEARVKALGG